MLNPCRALGKFYNLCAMAPRSIRACWNPPAPWGQSMHCRWMLAKSIAGKLKTVNPWKSTNKLCFKEDLSWPKPLKFCLNPILFLTHLPSLAALCSEPLVPVQAAISKFINMHVLFHKCWMIWKCCIRFCCLFSPHLFPKHFCHARSRIKKLEVRHGSALRFPCSFFPRSFASLQQMTLSNYLLALLFPHFGSHFSLNLVPLQLWRQSLTAKDITSTQHQPWGGFSFWILQFQADSQGKVNRESPNFKQKWATKQTVKSLKKQGGLILVWQSLAPNPGSAKGFPARLSSFSHLWTMQQKSSHHIWPVQDVACAFWKDGDNKVDKKRGNFTKETENPPANSSAVTLADLQRQNLRGKTEFKNYQTNIYSPYFKINAHVPKSVIYTDNSRLFIVFPCWRGNAEVVSWKH